MPPGSPYSGSLGSDICSPLWWHIPRASFMQAIPARVIVIDYCSPERMVADGLTKALGGVKHVVLVKMCGLS